MKNNEMYKAIIDWLHRNYWEKTKNYFFFIILPIIILFSLWYLVWGRHIELDEVYQIHDNAKFLELKKYEYCLLKNMEMSVYKSNKSLNIENNYYYLSTIYDAKYPNKNKIYIKKDSKIIFKQLWFEDIGEVAIKMGVFLGQVKTDDKTYSLVDVSGLIQGGTGFFFNFQNIKINNKYIKLCD